MDPWFIGLCHSNLPLIILSESMIDKLPQSHHARHRRNAVKRARRSDDIENADEKLVVSDGSEPRVLAYNRDCDDSMSARKKRRTC